MQMNCIYALALFITSTTPPGYWDRLAPIASDRLEVLTENFEKNFPEAKLINVSKDDKKEEGLTLYHAYWLSQRFKPYNGMFIAAEKKLPRDFEDRAWKDKHIVLIEEKTTRDLFYHLVLHFVLPEFVEREKISSEILELQKDKPVNEKKLTELKLALFELDIEVLTDLVLLQRAESFKWTESELKSIQARLQHQLPRVEMELRILKSQADKHGLNSASAQDFVKKLKDQLQTKEEPTSK